jgi:acyl dehydratase
VHAAAGNGDRVPHPVTEHATAPRSVGDELGCSEWFTVTQELVNTFAEATGDKQWIHLDAERAARESPYGGLVMTSPWWSLMTPISALGSEPVPPWNIATPYLDSTPR